MGTQKVNKTAGAVKCRSEKPFWSVGRGTRAGERLPRGWRGGGRWGTKSHPRSARSARPAERPARCGHGARWASERPGPCAAPRCRRWTRRLQGRELGSGRARCAAARRLNCTPQTEGHRLRDTARPLGMWRQRAKKKEKEKDSRARRHRSSLGATRSTPGGDALVCQRKLELRIFT